MAQPSDSARPARIICQLYAFAKNPLTFLLSTRAPLIPRAPPSVPLPSVPSPSPPHASPSSVACSPPPGHARRSSPLPRCGPLGGPLPSIRRSPPPPSPWASALAVFGLLAAAKVFARCLACGIWRWAWHGSNTAAAWVAAVGCRSALFAAAITDGIHRRHAAASQGGSARRRLRLRLRRLRPVIPALRRHFLWPPPADFVGV